MNPETKQPLTAGKLIPVLLLCLIGSQALAACDEPTFTITIPDGKTASEDEINAAYEAVNDFVKQGEDYITCIEEEEARTTAERLRDNMLDEMEGLAARFNRQLRYYRRANS